MLRFFRHIRKRLMEQKRIRTYVLYAAGEILLVMIGILLALQVNNWNDVAKERKMEQRYLLQIFEDFRQDSLQLAEQITNSDYQVDRKLRLLDYMDGNANAPDSLIDHFNAQWTMLFSFNPTTRTIDEITASGTLDVFRDQEVKNTLLQLYDVYEQFNARDLAAFNILHQNRLDLFYQLVPNLYTLSDQDLMKVLKMYQVENSIRGNSAISLNAGLKDIAEQNKKALSVIRKHI